MKQNKIDSKVTVHRRKRSKLYNPFSSSHILSMIADDPKISVDGLRIRMRKVVDDEDLWTDVYMCVEALRRLKVYNF
jgi:hypothetical protein